MCVCVCVLSGFITVTSPQTEDLLAVLPFIVDFSGGLLLLFVWNPPALLCSTLLYCALPCSALLISALLCSLPCSALLISALLCSLPCSALLISALLCSDLLLSPLMGSYMLLFAVICSLSALLCSTLLLSAVIGSYLL